MREKETMKNGVNLDLFYQGGALIVGILLSISLVRNILIISSANKKIQNLKNEISDIQIKNNSLKLQLQKVSKEEYLEQQARDKLGLVKEGETVVVLPDQEILRQFSPKIPEEEVTLPDPTWKKWMKLFI